MLGWVWLGLLDAQASVVINEFVANPDGADGGFEWIELYNDGSSPVDLTDWTLEKATSSFTTAHTIGSLTIPANGYVLIGEANVPATDEVATLALGNAGSNGDALRLVDDLGFVVDTVIYGPDNSDGFEDDNGLVPATTAPIASGASTARNPNGFDSDDASDFIVAATPSPGADNDSTLPTCDEVGSIQVVINELQPDPAGTDTDLEWVELYNAGSGTVDLSGWAIAAGTSSYSSQGTLPNGTTIAAGATLQVGQSSLSNPDVIANGFSLGNASNADAVQLRDCLGGVADTVVYGIDNSDGWLDDNGATAALAPKPGSGESIGRSPDGQDTDDSSVDFVVFTTPTPSDLNGNGPAPLVCDDAAGSGVVINELMPDPPGGDADNEWVELYNDGNSAVDISGWGIAAGTSSFGEPSVIGAGFVLQPGAFFVIGQSQATTPDAIAGFSLGNASNADGVQLVDCNGGVADTVIYGTDNSDGWVDDTGGAAALAPVPASGQTIGRIPDGADSNDSSVDFQVLPATRGISNTSPPPDCGGFGAGLVVNEFLTNPAGADTDLEWVELYHAGTETLDLEGWALEAAGSDTWTPKYTFEPGETIAPGDFLVIGGVLVPESDLPLSGSLGNGSNGDGLRVVDCAGMPSDVVVYGGNNDDGVTDETGNPANSVAPAPPEASSVQRLIDGYDTGTNHLDFAVAETPTPGAPNPEITPIECVPSAGGVRINELLPDPEGTDDGLEWIELYNAGSQPQSLDGWSFSAGTSDFDDRDILLPGGTTIEPGAFFVIGGELVEQADLVLTFTLGNGSSSRDGLRLFDCEGNVIDTAIYGATDEEEPDEGIVDDNGELAESYGDPGSNQSLYRVEDGIDTDAAEDWNIGRATPGESNVFESTGGGSGSKGCGCGGPPDGNAPQGGPNGEAPNRAGCSSLPTQTMPLTFALALVAARRRRRAIDVCHDAQRCPEDADAP